MLEHPPIAPPPVGAFFMEKVVTRGQKIVVYIALLLSLFNLSALFFGALGIMNGIDTVNERLFNLEGAMDYMDKMTN